MRKSLLYIFLLLPFPIVAQKLDSNRAGMLAEIEKNNTTLIALRQQAEADKAQNRVGNALPDPTFGFSYSWGNKSGMEGKKTFSAEQELDLGTLTRKRSKLAKSANAVIDWNYRLERQTILAEADLLLVQLVYHNANCEELSSRMERAKLLKEVYEKKMLAGDANQIELNKIRLFHTSAMANYKRAQAERAVTLDELQRLNGNQPVQYGHTEYSTIDLPTLNVLEEKAMDLSPLIQSANANIKQEKENLKLNKIEALPGVSIGYTGEHVGGNNYNGVSVGVSVPLWGNSRRKVSQQRTAVLAAEMNKHDAENQILSKMKLQYDNAKSLLELSKQYKTELANNEDLKILEKALKAGQISLLEYLTEVAFYDNARSEVLSIERDSQLAISQLFSIFQ